MGGKAWDTAKSVGKSIASTAKSWGSKAWNTAKDLGGIPIRNFYFDGTQSDLDRDLGVYMELARSYSRARK